MNAQKFTQKSLEAVQLAQDIALERGNMQIEPAHLLAALLEQENALIPQLLTKMGVDAQTFARELNKANQMPPSTIYEMKGMNFEDEAGNPIEVDGVPISAQKVDKDGKPVTDANGNPVMKEPSDYTAAELDALRAALSELDAGFDRRIGEKIQASVQIGNLRVPQVRSLLLSKLAAMGERGIDCRLEVLYPVERVYMDVWDFVRCLGVLIDNAAEAALETETPWVEVVLLAQEKGLSLRVSNPYVGTIDPDRLWTEGGSTKGSGRGLGLSGYQRILEEYPNAASSTNWAEGVFVQELSMGGRR